MGYPPLGRWWTLIHVLTLTISLSCSFSQHFCHLFFPTLNLSLRRIHSRVLHSFLFTFTTLTHPSLQRERSRSPRRRSRSPRRSRRSYSPRSRSRSRDDYRRSDRRSRSPISGAAGAGGGYSGSYGAPRGGPPARNFEDRAVAKEQMMQSLRESSQQDRRVYVGNLSYDVKWHHLKDFMRSGRLSSSIVGMDRH